jgi:ammonium transporter, Amt family
MGGFVGTMLTPVFAVAAIAPVTATVFTNLTGALAVMAYSAVVTWFILKFIAMFTKLRVTETEEKVGLDISQHGEMLSPHI